MEKDPEIQRLGAEFVASNYQFNAMVKLGMMSPLVTYAKPILTFATQGQTATLSRRNQLCGLLTNVSGLGEVCGRDGVNTSSAYDVSSLVLTVPGDPYGRGVTTPLFVTQPNPILRSSLENLCSLVAAQMVEKKPAVAVAQQSSDVAVPAMVHDLMGILADEDSAPIQILQKHWASVLDAKQPQAVAWQSTFTLACLSPFVVGFSQ